MFFLKKEPEKPNYGKIVAITLGIIAGIAAVGFGAYLFCKKKGIKLCICRSGEDIDDYWDDEDLLDELDAEDEEPEVEVEAKED